MNKVIKITLISIVGLFIAFIIIIFSLTKIINPNQFKPQITQLVKEKSGLELDISGNIKWTLFPSVGISVSNIELKNKQGFGNKPIAKIKQMALSVKLLPLIIKHVDVDTITLIDSQFNLYKKANGNANWQLSAQKPTTTATPEKATDSTASDTDFELNNINIKNAMVNYQDDSTGQTIKLNNFNLYAEDLSSSSNTPFSTSFQLQKNKQQIEVTIKSDAKVNLNRPSADLKNLKITANIKQGNGHSINMKLTGDTDLDLKAQTFNAKHMQGSINQLKFNGKVTGTQILKSPNVNAQLTVDTFNAKALLTDLGQSIKTSDSDALTAVSAKLSATYAGNKINLNNLKLTLDNTKVNGTASYNISPPQATANFQIDKINLDNYLSQASGSQANQTPASNSSPNKASPQPTTIPALVKQLRVNAKLNIKQLTINKLQFNAINLAVNGQNGDYQLPLSANFYQGQINGNLGINVTSQTPKISIRQTANNIDVGALVQDMSGKALISGKGSISLNVNTQGMAVNNLLQNLKGTANFNLNNGKINNLNLLSSVKTIDNKVNNTTNSNQGNNNLLFSQLSADANFNNGIATSNSIKLNSSALTVRGTGTTNLLSQTINYTIVVTLLDNRFGGNLLSTQNKIGGSFPIILRGKITKPMPTPDVATALAGIAKQKLDTELKSKLIKSLPGMKLDNLLR